MKVAKLYSGNVVYGKLPLGCRFCLRGLKSVIFVTGVCPRDCFYCPINREKRGRDVFYVNERPVCGLNELVAEILISGSRGAGLTGGDPLSKPLRTLSIIRQLKSAFGEEFHIHLYTSGKMLSAQILSLLEKSGLNEMRIHPDFPDLGKVLSLLKAFKPNFSVGFEIPSLPDRFNETLELVDLAASSEVIDFINVNELEFSESNSAELRKRGYELTEDWKSARGSRESALKLIEIAKSRGYAISIHFCPARSKDSYQTRLRLYRRGVTSALPHEMVSDEGTILKAQVPESCESVPHLLMFRGSMGPETSLLVAELVGAHYRVIEELPDYKRTLLNVV